MMNEVTNLRKLLLLLSATMIVIMLVSFAQAEGMADGSLLTLASPDAPLTADDAPGTLRPISTENVGVYLTTSVNMLVQERVLAPLYQMMQAAERDGCTLYVRQAYRSYADEARRYDMLSAMGRAAQKPGESSYQTGLSVTLVGAEWKTRELTEAFADSSEAKWLAAHAAEYGFVLRYPAGKEDVTGWRYEPWHYRYVGSAAAVMAERGLCLEELVADAALIAQLPEDVSLPGNGFETGRKKPKAELEEIGDAENAMQETEEADQPTNPADDENETGEADPEPSVAGEEAQEVIGNKEHSKPEKINVEEFDPEDIGPDGDYELHFGK